MEKSGAKAYLVNTGWNGTGKRISIKDTRGIIDAILNGDINNAPTKKIPYFNFEVPTELTVLIQESLILVTHMLMLLSGKKRQKILLEDSSRTSLSAWSMGIGSCCLGGPVRFMKSPAAAEYMKQLGFSEGYELLYAIAFGYPDEMPAAKPREVSKVKFVD